MKVTQTAYESASALVGTPGRAPGAATGARNPRPSLATGFVEPSSGFEQTVADLWAAALGLDRVGADDDFFELGGRSMTAVLLAQRIATDLRVPLTVSALIEHPTVRLLCAELESRTS
jgi:hypothetical protein